MRPLIFAPCERVIIEHGSKTVSLLSILDELALADAADGLPPENAVSPQTWYVLTLWRCEDDEVGQRFEQKMSLINPKGKTILEMVSPVFEMDKNQHRHVNTIRGFPIGVSGGYVIRLAIRSEGEADFKEVTTYPLLVKHPTAEPASV